MTTYAPPAVVIVPWTKTLAEVDTWTRVQSSASLGGGSYQSNGNSGNSVSYRVALGAGTYTITAIGVVSTNYGISTVTLDGTSVGTLDWYAAAPADDTVKTITGVTVATAGVYTFAMTSTTKNASASHYSQAFNLLALHRTDDASGPIVGGTLPHRVDLVPWAGTDYALTGSWTRTQASGNLGGGSYGGPTTQNNAATWMVPLAAGTWTITAIGLVDASYGISTVTLAGTSVGTIDWYAGSAADDTVKTITGVTVAQDGIYALKFTAATKHASSTNYTQRFQHIVCQRTGS